MAETTAIAWTRSTFNPWIGCTKIGPGCDHCYAEALDKRHKWGGATHWGAGVPRFRTSAKNWSHPIEWNKLAALEQRSGILTLGSDWKGKVGFWPVFCASLADVFDNEVDPMWRHDLWKLIINTPNLEWLIVTKRIGNVAGMWPILTSNEAPPNVRLLITVCNQEEADRDIPKLLALPCKNGVSYEPALGGVDWSPWLKIAWQCSGCRGFFPDPWKKICPDCGKEDYWCGSHRFNPPGGQRGSGLDWIIVGGESTQGSGKARPFDLAWARSTVAQCKAAGVPVFVKQAGSNAQEIAYPSCSTIAEENYWHADGWTSIHEDDKTHWRKYYRLKHRAGANPAEWPEELRHQEFPA